MTGMQLEHCSCRCRTRRQLPGALDASPGRKKQRLAGKSTSCIAAIERIGESVRIRSCARRQQILCRLAPVIYDRL